MGIGLAIVKKILELHQASIQVSSEPGKGAAFWFVLPVFTRGAVNS
jgi:signal transduction histidine kinase